MLNVLYLNLPVPLLLLCTLVCQAQFDIFLAMNKGGKVKRLYFYEGTDISIKVHDDRTLYTGKLTGFKKDAIILDKTDIPIKEIRMLKLKKKLGINSLFGKFSEGLLVSSIGYLSFDLLNGRYFNYNSVVYHSTPYTVGSLLLGAWIFHQLTIRRHRIRGKKSLQIIDLRN
ncbi:MAG: hypothetical protein IH946_01225 [Bacteroidetes bacterium]|nr:hypothetical protein [Bacteroidota bacterium]